jgi:glucosylceramidase
MAIIAASTLATALSGASPVMASADRDNGGATVAGTYSTGAAHAWQPLPPVRIGDGKSTPVDATVVIDPSQLRQRYAGIGFSIDETSVSNLWKLTPAQREEAIRLLVDPKNGPDSTGSA